MASAVDSQPQTKLKSELQCVFCQANIQSTNMLTEHLMLCGNKTEQCPNCEKFIRRAIFAYHYENQCANLDEPDVTATTTTNNSVQLRTYQLEKSSAPKISQRHSLDIVECEFCRQKCARSDYQTHQDNCLKNPEKNKSNRQRTSLLPDTSRRDLPTAESADVTYIPCEFCRQKCTKNDYQTHKDNCLKNPEKNKPNRRDLSTAESTDVTYIPCEYCQKQIDFNQFSTHTEQCRQKETRRLRTRAEIINREPGIDQVECAYCKESQPLRHLHGHELSCDRNPRNERANRSRIRSLASTLPSLSIPSYRTLFNMNSTDPSSSIRNKFDEFRETEKQRRLSSHVKASLEQPVGISEPQRESSSSLINSDYKNSERGRPSTSSHSNVDRLSSQREKRSSATSLDRRPREHERDSSSTRSTSSMSHTSRAHSARRVCSTETHTTSRYQLAKPIASNPTYQPIIIRGSTRPRPSSGASKPPLMQPPMKF